MQIMSIQRPQPLRGTLKRGELLARYTSWRVGGPADQFYQPADVADLATFLAALPRGEPLFWLGMGSNLLIREGGLRGTVISPRGCLNELTFLPAQRVRVEAGVACPKLARETARRGLQGVEFLCGIPGTFGGALAMNAGALGSETWEWVESVETLDREGKHHSRTPGEYQVAYRQVTGVENEWFVAATLQLKPGDAEASLERIKQYLARRSHTQPTQLPNAGSVFRNPPGDFAARLIEACGLKGSCVGGACVSEKHANFIVNTGTATATDIEALIERIEQRVEAEYGVKLKREVHIVGEEREKANG